jgi:hypothetical protein
MIYVQMNISVTFTATAAIITSSPFITKEEELQITKALIKADDEDMAKSLQLAMKLHEEEEKSYNSYKRKEDEIILHNGNNGNYSNVRLVTHDEYNHLKNKVSIDAGRGKGIGASEEKNACWEKMVMNYMNSITTIKILINKMIMIMMKLPDFK